MSDDSAPPGSDAPAAGPEVRASEPVVWDTLRRTLEADGNDEAVTYLEYLTRVQHIESVPVDQDDKRYTRVRFGVYQRLSEYNARYNASSGAPMSWFVSSLMEDGGDAMQPDQGLEIARHVAQPPEDAVLEQSSYEDFNGEPVFVVRWSHWVNGIVVEPDYIHVMINGNTRQAFGFRVHWHMPSPQPSER